jgi:hypothetical protein
VADCLDIVAVRIEDEGSIVIRMVIWAYSRLSIVPAAGGDRFIMKSVHGGPILCRKGYVSTCLRSVSPCDPEEGFGTDAIARVLFGFCV